MMTDSIKPVMYVSQDSHGELFQYLCGQMSHNKFQKYIGPAIFEIRPVLEMEISDAKVIRDPVG